MKKTLTPSFELVKPSALLVKQHIVPIMYLVLLPSLVYTLGALQLSSLIKPDGSFQTDLYAQHFVGLALIGIASLWTLINLGPMNYFLLHATKNKTSLPLSQYYRAALRLSLPLLGLYVVISFLVVGGLLLLIIPGLIMIRRYLLAPYYFIDQKLTLRQSLRASAADSKPFAPYIWGIIGVQLFFNLVAMALQTIPILGIVMSEIVTLMIVFVAVLRYREIQKSAL